MYMQSRSVRVDLSTHREIKALAAELGPELAILAPDVAEAFPDSEAVNAALRAVLEAAKTVRKSPPRKRTRTA